MPKNEQPPDEQSPERQSSELSDMVRADREGNGNRRRKPRRHLPEIGDERGLGGPDGPPFNVSLSRSAVRLDNDAALWSAIRNRTEAIRADRYEEFIKRVFCNETINEGAVCIEKEGDGYTPNISRAIEEKR